MNSIDFKSVESKWQKRWKDKNCHKFVFSNDNIKNKKYVLTMFSYPSGDKLHIVLFIHPSDVVFSNKSFSPCPEQIPKLLYRGQLQFEIDSSVFAIIFDIILSVSSPTDLRVSANSA